MNKLLIIGTGGTIAGLGNQKGNSDTDYTSGKLPIETLTKAIEYDSNAVDITVMQLCNVNSDDITSSHWISLAKAINENSDIYDGIIITHGTDTLEETAFFLEMTTKHKVPVIITCAMYPSDSILSDGPANLNRSVDVMMKWIKEGYTVSCPFINCEFENYAPLSLVCNGKIIPAYKATKIYSPGNGFSFEEIEFELCQLKEFFRHYDISQAYELPKVPILTFYTEADFIFPDYISHIEPAYIVISGAGAGEFSLEWERRIESLSETGVIFIRTSKINKAPVNTNQCQGAHTLNAGNLSPEKAAILARLQMI